MLWWLLDSEHCNHGFWQRIAIKSSPRPRTLAAGSEKSLRGHGLWLRSASMFCCGHCLWQQLAFLHFPRNCWSSFDSDIYNCELSGGFRSGDRAPQSALWGLVDAIDRIVCCLLPPRLTLAAGACRGCHLAPRLKLASLVDVVVVVGHFSFSYLCMYYYSSKSGRIGIEI